MLHGVDPDETAHYEQHRLDLYYLQFQMPSYLFCNLFSFSFLICFLAFDFISIISVMLDTIPGL